ncbi:HDIG domain-containing metalloprotein [Clostridium lacusfryxellense]|uniref:HDIG domain-containing metalloprotein n=1 Tax=Clostridium lacusfryxellense TaxID=205328 RepID=UPI001C0E4E4D|nr:HDIG domain-containing metalloprotein [Clostridium lacusfryxellense]MBU3114658.1 HDIG domain-containing protein [Clostridium lacusfryxellense]
MSLYRVKQFYWSMISKINNDDIDFLKMYLETYELKLFNQLPIYEQKHCINVARDVKLTCNKRRLREKYLIKVALLHDIGKIYHTMNPIEKSIMVIMHKLTNGRIRAYKNIKNINVYYNHGDIGFDLLKKYGYDDRFLFIVKNHHNNNIHDDIELNVIRECDDRN